jgi:hypothetical protein
MKSLLKEFTNQMQLSKSDGSDAGKNDVAGKGSGTNDVRFSLMRNAINSNGKVTGSDVADYLEKAHSINDEVESTLYGLETDDGEVVKVYVNAAQSDAFEVEMKKLLGMEDDIEEAINQLASKFDIVDVIWPKGSGPNDEDDEDNEGGIDVDATASIGDPDDSDDDEMDVIASEDDETDRTGGTGDDVSQAPADAEEVPAEEEEPAAEEEEEEEEEEEVVPPASGKKKDQKHSKLKDVGSKMKKEGYEPATTTQGDNMSIGNKFLTRVLAEGHLDEARTAKPAEDRDGVVDGFNVQLDSQQRMLVSKLKYKLEKQVIVLFSMIGIPGMKLNTEGIVSSVQSASETLRTQLSVRRAFTDFVTAYAKAKGAYIDPKAPEPVSEAKLKRGNYLQKQLETILVKLGLPEDLVSTTGPAVVGQALYRASKVIEDSADLKLKMRMLAIRMGIKPSDAAAPLSDEKAMTEAVDPAGADLYADAVMQLVALLGVPDEAFARNAKMTLGKHFRDMRSGVNVGMLLPLVKGFSNRLASSAERAVKPSAKPAMQ